MEVALVVQLIDLMLSGGVLAILLMAMNNEPPDGMA